MATATTTPHCGVNADASSTSIVSISQTKDTGTIDKDGADELIYATVGDATLDGGTGTDEISFASTSKTGAPVFFFGALADLGLGIGGALVSGEYYRYVLTDFESVEGTTYHDTIRGDEGDNTLSGLSGNDRLEGKDGNDTIYAGDGADKVDGGWGNDSLFAGKGDDTLIGGEGVDTAVFSTAIGSSTTFSNGVTVDLGAGEATARISSQTHTYDLTEIENITGSNADDMLTGDDGDNVITGNQGDDTIMGGADDDTIMGGAGDDYIAGGEGVDAALYAGASNHFTLQYDLAEGRAYVIDRTGVEGTDTIDTDILRFSDTDIALGNDGGGLLQYLDFDGFPFTELVELYIAYFNRAPDAKGLHFWLSEVIDGTTLDAAAEYFFNQPETQALYGSDVNLAQFVAQVYENVLGRQPDATGSGFWIDALTTGAVTEGQFIRTFLQGARAETPKDADAEFSTQQDADRAYLDAKTNIGIDFAATKGMSDLSDANAVMALFDGSAASIADAAVAAQDAYQEALGSDGAFLIQLIGIDTEISSTALM